MDSRGSSAPSVDCDADLISPDPPAQVRPDGLPSLQTAAPRISNLFDSPKGDIIVSPQSHALSGAGVFSSAESIARCLDETAVDFGSNSACQAHIVFPSDGSNLSISSVRCANQPVTKTILIGGDIILTNGTPLRVGIDGGATFLCLDHEARYQRLIGLYRCCVKECVNKGVTIDFDESTITACPLHLQEQIMLVAGNPSDKCLPAAKTDIPLKNVATMFDHGKVPVQTDNNKQFQMGNQKDMFGHVIVPTDTSASESWTDREKELKLLKGSRRCDKDHQMKTRLRDEDREKDGHVKPRKRRSRNRSSSSNSVTSIESRVTTFRKSISTKGGCPLTPRQLPR